MFKRIISVLLAVLLIFAMAVVAVSAADTSQSEAAADTPSEASGAGKYLTFDSQGWSGFNTIYCHIWIIGGANFYGWGADAEKCEKVDATTYRYDLSKLDNSLNIEGGLKKGVDYCVIFHDNGALQTCDTTMGVECIGDTAYLTGEKYENTVDSSKTGWEIEWADNSSKYGTHLAITSVGTLIGSKLAPNENPVQTIGDWVYKYYSSVYMDDPAVPLKAALPKFGVTSAEAINNVYAYILTLNPNDDELPDIKAVLEKASGKKIDEKAAEETAEKIESGEEDISELAAGTTGGNNSNGGSNGGSNYSGSGDDGQETTIFFVLLAVMTAAAGVMFVTRRRED